MQADLFVSGEETVTSERLVTRRESRSRPRILLLCADQLRADALGCYNNTVVETPHIDRLARSGLRFAKHYTPSVPCAPSRATLLTGLYQLTHRVVNNHTPFDSRIPNLAYTLTEAGIPSHLIGYTDTTVAPFIGGSEGVMPGFSIYAHFNLNEHGLRPWVRTLESRGYGPFAEAKEAFCYERPLDNVPVNQESRKALYDSTESDTAFLADRTIECIIEHQNEPWFIHTAFLRPHGPWVAPEPYNARFSQKDMAGSTRAGSPSAEAKLHPFLSYWIDRIAHTRSPEGDPYSTLLPEDNLATVRAIYLGLVAELDHHIGRILTTLELLGLIDKTLIIFTSDHGDMLGDHWLFGAGGFFDAAYHVPLVILDPHSTSDSKSPGPVNVFTESVDIAPTILDWAEVPLLDWSDGYSLLCFLRGARASWRRDATFWEFDFRDTKSATAERALGISSEDCVLNVWRTDYYKYVHFSGLPPLLFDLTADPGELTNYAQAPAYRDVVATCVQNLLSHRIRHADQRRANRAIE